MELVRSPGLIEISTSANRKIVWYYVKNIDKFQNYNIFLNSLKSDLIHTLKTHVKKNAIKFNLKLEATYNRPRVGNSSENRAFKTSAVELLRELGVSAIVIYYVICYAVISTYNMVWHEMRISVFVLHLRHNLHESIL